MKKVAVLNLMPTKIKTENQFREIFAAIDENLELSFIRLESYISKNTSKTYLDNNYLPTSKLADYDFDRLIITGAPLEAKEFQEIEYWDELQRVFAYADKNIKSTIYICWSVIAALKYRYGIDKNLVSDKIFGLYSQEVLADNKLLAREVEEFKIPHSRYFKLSEPEIKGAGLKILSAGREVGPTIFASKGLKEIYITGHFEYNEKTLIKEYERDLAKGLEIAPPENYLSSGDSLTPVDNWDEIRTVFYKNWLSVI
ncbi:MAG: homoserine O-acetyltransferase/O-succinyltransferase family protein [Bacillota bacterium]